MQVVEKFFVTLLAGIGLLILEVWILALLVMVLGLIFTFALSPLYAQCSLDEKFAAEHPWRYHVAHGAFWGQKVVSALVVLSLSLWSIFLVSSRFPDAAYWWALYIEAVVLSRQFFPNDANSLVLISAISYRLRGKQSKITAPPQIGTVGAVYLEPIAVRRHGW